MILFYIMGGRVVDVHTIFEGLMGRNGRANYITTET